ncbi:MAG TPA: alpha/beta hydrolase [Pseudonocardiaceae bacterium]|jgi:acetyl esterase/lipase|nr:alpha/beta hydrolase [Pseudonocardiaceae bacterium]
MSVRRHAYGSGPDQYLELHAPTGTPRQGTVVVIHGGFWRAGYDAALGRPLAADLALRGWTAVNLDYRPSNRGGWRGTFDDVAAGIDHLADLDVDTDNLVAIGHSAGGQLAVWAAGRAGLPASAPGASPRVSLAGVISQAGVLDLATAARNRVGGRSVHKLLGGAPEEVGDRYALADPIARLPLAVPVVCLHSRADDLVPFTQSAAYVAAADQAAGKTARLVEVDGDHFAHLKPSSPAWAAAVQALRELPTSR